MENWHLQLILFCALTPIFLVMVLKNGKNWQLMVLPVVLNILDPEAEWRDNLRQIQGVYKERAVSSLYSSGRYGQSLLFRVVPLRVLRKQKLLMINYPKPTQHTYIRDDIIYLDFLNFPPAIKLDDYSGEKGKFVVLQAFDELIRAAEIVEADMRFYKGRLGEQKDMRSIDISIGESGYDSLNTHDRLDIKTAIVGFLFVTLALLIILIVFFRFF